MGLNFKKNTVVGVSVTPGIGVEAAIVNFNKRILQGYVAKPFKFDSKLQGDFDLDIFKETLYDALVELGAPKGSEIVLNLPSVLFAVKDWPASIEKQQLELNIEDEISESPAFRDSADGPLFSFCQLPNSTLQFSKVVCEALPKNLVLEMALQIKDLQYKLVAIDTSVNSTLNALIFSGRVDVSPASQWIMLMVDDNCCRVIPMQSMNYVDCIEESITIGSVLDEAENYSAITSVVEPVLKRIPSSLLYVVSKTDVISAEKLASKITYDAQIVHQEVNQYNQTPFLDLAFDMDPEIGKQVSLDVIGAAIKRGLTDSATASLNLFNAQLGEVYLSQTPPVLWGIELSVENMLKYGIFFAVLILAVTLSFSFTMDRQRAEKEIKINEYNNNIAEIEKYLKEHEDISSQQFSEADEIRIGLEDNKAVYSYYTIVGTEIPKKLWLTSLKLGDQVTVEGQADNLESVYGFFRNIKDYDPNSPVKLQKLGLAGKRNASGFGEIAGEDFDTESVLTSLNADFYEFIISDRAVETPKKQKDKADNNAGGLPDLEILE